MKQLEPESLGNGADQSLVGNDQSHDSFQLALREYIKSGEYFKDARDWYNSKYLHIVTHRSVLFIALSVMLVAFSVLFINGYALLPMKRQVDYYINTKDSDRTAVNITRASYIENNPISSIADIMVRNYIKIRESYDYNSLKEQFTYVKNNSTRIIYRKFFSFMNTDNQGSPILKFQRFTRRGINIISATYPTHGKAVIVFESIAKLTSGEIVENSIWQTSLDFEMDDINLNLPAGSKFNFAITNYNTTLKKDKLTK